MQRYYTWFKTNKDKKVQTTKIWAKKIDHVIMNECKKYLNNQKIELHFLHLTERSHLYSHTHT